jgi:nucleotide-binding universal stress UspA family protein
MLNKILIPLDGSELSERALLPGLQLAQHAEAQLVLLSSLVPERVAVSDAYAVGAYGTLSALQPLAKARKDLAQYLHSVHAHKIPAGVEVKVELREGDPAESIVEAAKTAEAGLIVMSSHGYSGISRWVMGSVAERVLYKAPCPVLIVRSAKPTLHMLIPLDGSALSEQVLGTALEVAVNLQCRVTLMRAIQPSNSVDLTELEKMEPGLGRSYQEEIHLETEDYLTPFANKYRGRVPELNTLVMHGPAAQSILDYADLHDVDMIAMSTHGRTGLKRWIYGSVTEKVLHAAGSCSMLVVRPETNRLN